MDRHIYRGLPIVLLLIISSIKGANLESSTAIYPHAAVATEVARCSTMGREILQKHGGSAVDAAITSLLCIAVVNPQSTSIAGGFNMVVYINDTKEALALIATETAPAAASPHMFANANVSKHGITAIAVPGEVMGLWEAHQRFGKLPWADLFTPIIELAETGFQMSEHMSWTLNRLDLSLFPILREMYSRDDGDLLQPGDTLTNPELANTLRKIAANGPQEFYTGSIAEDLVQEIQEAGGIITLDDLATYHVEWTAASSMVFKNKMKLFSIPHTGHALQYSLNVLDEYEITEDDFSSLDKKLQLYHRYLETIKFTTALMAHVGDDPASPVVQKVLANFNSKEFAKQTLYVINDTHVTYPTRYDYDILKFVLDEFPEEEKKEEGLGGDTTHLSVLADNGDAVSLTASVGDFFGSRIYSRKLGVWLNSHMSDFYFSNREPNPIWHWPSANGIAPKRRYKTTVSPSILTDAKDGTVKMVVGASGGLKIPPTMTWVIMRTMWMDANLQDAIDEKRIYNYLSEANVARYEEGFPEDIVNGLETYGHTTELWWKYSVVQAIMRTKDGNLEAYCDKRKQGQPDGY